MHSASRACPGGEASSERASTTQVRTTTRYSLPWKKPPPGWPTNERNCTVNFTDIADEVAKANPVEPVGVPTVPGRRVHIDGDMLAYQCGGNDDTDVATSRRILKSKIDLFKDASGAEGVLLHLTASGSTKGDRAAIAYTKPYQGQRKGHRPKNWQYLRDYMAEGLAGPVKQWFDREADDGFGFISMNC